MAEYLLPDSLSEATEIIAEHGRALAIVAGGTSAMRCGTCRGKHGRGILCLECPGPRLVSVPNAAFVMGIQRLGLDGVAPANGGLGFGAGLSLSRLQASAPIPALRAAARQVGGPALRNMATVGGNIFERQPYGDVAVVLLALDASLTFAERDGERSQTLAAFYADGAKQGGLLTRIDCAAPDGEVVFLKCGRRRFNSPTVVTVAVCIALDGGKVRRARIALGGAGAHPMRCAAAEELLIGAALDPTSIAAAAAAAADACDPATDVVASEWYRRRMVATYVRRALGEIEQGS